MKKRGKVTVVYMTLSDPNLINDAISAMSIINVKKKDLIFLKYKQISDFKKYEKVKEAMKRIKEILLKKKPDEVYIPAYEGGHRDHDISNYMVSHVINKNKIKTKVFESPEYSLFFSFLTPKRIIDKIIRRLFKMNFSPSFITHGKTITLKMKKDEIETKKEMFMKYKTKNVNNTLIKNYGFCDKYRKYTQHNYLKPPFNYRCSLAYWITKIIHLITGKGNVLKYGIGFDDFKEFREIVKKTENIY